jgi:hypothetical protein
MKLEFDEVLGKALGVVQKVGEGIPTIADSKKFAEDESIKAYGKETQHNGKADAMRHILFSALNSQNLTETGAKVVSSVHEHTEFNQPKAEMNMDFFNDAIGREIARRAKTKEEMIQLAKEAVDSGKVQLLNKDQTGPYY